MEKYAIDNDIQYNILYNSQNINAIIPQDARMLLMKVFENFEILIVFLIIYLSCTTISEEYYMGTIKNILIKPHTRLRILLSKILTNVILIILSIIILLIFQYLIGGLLFGFESYSLDAIRYNIFSENILTIKLSKYMLIIAGLKTFEYIVLSSFSLLLGIIINNIALNILIFIGIYFLSNIKSCINSITQYLFIYNWDISSFLFTYDKLLYQSVIISSITLIIIFLFLIVIFKNKDIKNM